MEGEGYNCLKTISSSSSFISGQDDSDSVPCSDVYIEITTLEDTNSRFVKLRTAKLLQIGFYLSVKVVLVVLPITEKAANISVLSLKMKRKET